MAAPMEPMLGNIQIASVLLQKNVLINVHFALQTGLKRSMSSSTLVLQIFGLQVPNVRVVRRVRRPRPSTSLLSPPRSKEQGSKATYLLDRT